MGDSRVYLTHEEVQGEILRMLKAFRGFADRRGISFSLIGGTALGAVRHGGFIPWDDDADLGLARPDFERVKGLGEELEAETGLVLRSYGRTPLEVAPLLKVGNPLIGAREGSGNADGLLWVDLCPVDGLPDGNLASLYARAKNLRRLICLPEERWGVGSSPARRALRLPMKAIVGPLRLDIAAARKLDSLAHGTPYGASEWCGILTWGMYGAGERMPLVGFEEKVSVSFEGDAFPIMACWDEYLTGIYGNYMTPPPEEMRVTHGTRAWRVRSEETSGVPGQAHYGREGA